MRCPCRKTSETETYEACCGRYHGGAATAPTAEALMRSRYSAFARRNTPYLLATWHASTRPKELTHETGVEWYMLKIIASAEVGDEATVEFQARSRLLGRTHVLHERSRFKRVEHRWFYVDGRFPDDTGAIPSAPI